MSTVFTVGVFDMLHYGHMELFRRAKQLAMADGSENGKLIVAVQEDAAIKKYKPEAQIIYPAEIRCEMIRSLRTVDEVVLYADVDEIVKNIDFDDFITGGDQTHAGFRRAIDWCRENGRNVIRLSRTACISTSELKQKIKELP